MKCHLIDTNEPLKSGGDMTANCGAEIRKAEFAFMFDLELVPLTDGNLSAVRFCKNCRGTRLAKRYIYGVIEGQELRMGAA